MDILSYILGKKAGGGGGEAVLINKSVTANGTYNASADSADGYKKVEVAVPNSYGASDEGKVVSNGTLVSQGSDTVTENDTYDTTLISEMTVNVSASGTDYLAQLLSNTITTYTNDTTVNWERGSFGYTPIQSVTFSALKNLNANNAFQMCSSLTSVSMPVVEKIKGGSAFEGTKIVNFISHTVGFISSNSFKNCLSLELACIPNGYPRGSFYGCSKLECVDTKGFYGNDDGSQKKVSQYTFYNCSLLNTLIIREINLMPLDNLNAFQGTPYYSGGAGGDIYVPSALIDSYKAATNWSTLNGYGTITWHAIEGSYYETHYADGTVIS